MALRRNQAHQEYLGSGGGVVGDNSHPWFWHMESVRTGEELSDASPDAGRADTRGQPNAGPPFTQEHLTRDLFHVLFFQEKKKKKKKSCWRARRGEIEDKVGMRREKKKETGKQI